MKTKKKLKSWGDETVILKLEDWRTDNWAKLLDFENFELQNLGRDSDAYQK